jgi:hypothetical protein
MWGMQQTSYCLEIVPGNLNSGITAYMVDNYLHTSQPLNLSDSSRIPFTVNNDPASYDQFRFKIIFSAFQKQPPVPFSFVSSEAVNQHSQVLINWETTNEMNLVNYQIQRSADKVNYQPIATVDAVNSGTNNYKWADRNPLTENSFYRIRGIEANGTSSYSEVLKVMNPKVSAGISIYPNPVVGNTINLKLYNQETGTYKVNVYNSFGAVVLTHEFNGSAANSFVKIPVDKTISKGVYYLEITAPSGRKQSINMLY